MAGNEISTTLRLKISNGGFKTERNQGTVNIDQATLGSQGGVQNIGTTAELVALGDVATVGYAYFANLDATNFVQIGIDVAATFYPVIKLNPGEGQVFRIDPAATLYAKADTAACNLDTLILEA